MLDRQSVYQRTDSGRNEIRNKSHGLTQSERLILILIDGVGTLASIRARLHGLTDERFDRAVRKLLASQLIEIILLQLEQPVPEQVDEHVANNFLRQDPLDPVTIISFEPEEDFPVNDISLQDTLATRGSGTLPAPRVIGHAPEALIESLSPPTLTGIIQPAKQDRMQAPGPVDPVDFKSTTRVPAHPASTLSSYSGIHSVTANTSEDSFAWQYWATLLIVSAVTSIVILAL